jgi:prevent-host-death family protein
MQSFTAKQARSHFSLLLKKAEKGEDIIVVRRGRKIARLSKAPNKKTTIPSLKDFRKTISSKGRSLSDTVIRMREEGR